MSTVAEKRRYTVAEYLALELASPIKHEYYRGEIFAMAGASIRHNEISCNIMTALREKLRGKGCKPYGSDQRIRIEKADQFTYADTAVICGQVERDAKDPQAAKNPRVIFEVLSKSTEVYDRGQKFEFYQTLPSLKEYVLVSQHDAKITQFVRQEDGTWRYILIAGLDQSLTLTSLGCDLALTEVYDGVALGPEEEVAV